MKYFIQDRLEVSIAAKIENTAEEKKIRSKQISKFEGNEL